MDAVHNLPSLITRWDKVDVPRLPSMLAEFDRRWSPPHALLTVYDDALAGRSFL